MRKEVRFSVATDEAIDAVLRDMVAKEAPPMLKARVLARLGDEVIDAALHNLAAREVPSTLRARVMARLDEDPVRTLRSRTERWTFVQPLLRPAFGLAAVGLVAATALTVWLSRTPPPPAPVREGADYAANRPDGGSERATAGKGPRARSEGAATDRGSPSGGALASAGATRASRPARPPGVTRLARHTTARSGAESEDAASDADDPLAIRQLRVDALSVSTIAIPPIEVAPVEIVPPMSDAAPNPPGESGTESRTGG